MNRPDEKPPSGPEEPREFGMTALNVAQALDGITLQATTRTGQTNPFLTSPDGNTRYPGVGTIAFRRYCLQRVLGRGGMGVVWLALDMKLERTVALKFLPDVVSTDSDALKELKDETRRGLDLAHPNIVRIYDFVDDSEAAAISMEYVDGRSLHEMRAGQPDKVFSASELTPWIRQLCDALDYAHNQRHIVHRDLKPANLMVNSQGELKITDFGIARSLSDTLSRVTGASTSGTLLFMSPQQSMGDRPQPTDDIYSVGATIFDLLTGKPPFFRGDIAVQVASKIAPSMKDRRAEFGVTVAEEIPKEWEETVAACLDKDPAYRPQTAKEIIARLGLDTKGETKPIVVVMRPEGSRKDQTEVQLHPRKAFNPWLLRLTLLFVLALAALFGIGWWETRSGSWAVDTNPPGAYVTIGDVTQVSPARFDHLKPGLYHAEITMDGFESHELEFRVKPGMSVNIGIVRLIPGVGSLSLTDDDKGEAFELKSVTTAIVPPQPAVGEPEEGFWNLDELFAHSEYAGFSPNGRRYLLSAALQAMQEQGQMKLSISPEPGPDFHQAVKAFQRLNDLKPNGQLDSATVLAMGLSSVPDKADWSPHSAEKDEGWWRRNVSRPIGRLFGAGQKE